MLSLTLLFALADPDRKALPTVKEPDWNAWKDVTPKAKPQAMEAWAVLREYRPHCKLKTTANPHAPYSLLAPLLRLLADERCRQATHQFQRPPITSRNVP